MNQKIIPRVRFAPSPTGYLHLGGLRAAFFNWLFAKHFNGKFLLRIEDTDLARSKPEYTDSILDSLSWSNINSDEPIVIQSKNIGIHNDVINKMLADGTAYRCFCPADQSQEIADFQDDQAGYNKYDQKCRDVDLKSLDVSKSYAVRFKVPRDNKFIIFKDLIRGEVSFDIDQIDDFILVRSDGTPTYNFVVVVDDATMEITHVLRGEEHLSNTPKQILIYRACNFYIPQFGHLPLILGPTGAKLSKRDAATSVIDYKNNGFLAQALCNYLVRLGWSHGDQEIFTIDELIKYFSLDHVGKKGAIFDIKKLEWTNSVYIKQHTSEELLNFIEKDIDKSFSSKLINWDRKTILGFIDLYKERVKTLKELIGELEIIYHVSKSFNLEEIKIFANLQVKNNLEKVLEILENIHDFSIQNLNDSIKKLVKDMGINLPDIAKPLRLALTGKLSSPGIFEILFLLGKKESIERINFFKKEIEKKFGEESSGNTSI